MSFCFAEEAKGQLSVIAKRGEWPNHGRGIGDLKVVGSLVYISQGGAVSAMDASDPAHLRPLGSHRFKARGLELAVKSGVVFVANGIDGFHIVDFQDPLRPREIGHLKTGGDVRTITVEQNAVYVGHEDGSVTVIDASDYAAPRVVKSLALTGRPKSIDINGQRLFVLLESELHILDVRNPLDPRPLGLFRHGYLEGVCIVGDKVFLTSNTDINLFVLDITNPSQPSRLADLRSLNARGDVVFHENELLIGSSSQQLSMVDVRDPAKPQLKRQSRLINGPRHIAVMNGKGVISNGGSIYTVSLDDSIMSSWISRYSGSWGFNRVLVKDRMAFAVDGSWGERHAMGLMVFDVSDPSAPKLVNEVRTEAPPLDLAMKDNYLYLGDAGRVRVINIEDLGHPRPEAELSFPHRPTDLEIAGNFLFVAAGTITVVDISNPQAATVTKNLPEPAFCEALSLEGSILAAAGGTTFMLFDVTDPSQPQVLFRERIFGEITDVKLTGNRLYMSHYSSGIINIYDVSNPGATKRIGHTVGPGQPDDFLVWLGHGLFTTPDGFSVTRLPLSPNLMTEAKFETPGRARSVSVADGMVFVGHEYGLTIFPSLPGLSRRIRVNGSSSPGITLQSTTSLFPPVQWVDVASTNAPRFPFDFTDLERPQPPQKFYRLAP